MYIAGGLTTGHEKNCIDCSTGVDSSGQDLLYHFCCDRYNVKERKYYKTDHRLPISLGGYSGMATDENETFIIIKMFTYKSRENDRSNNFLVFSKEHGFNVLHSEIVK